MNERLILASTSPRRIELMRQVGFSPVVLSPDVDERVIPREAPRTMVARLAREKARAAADRLGKGSAVIVAADTTVVAPNGRAILGKPRDRKEAVRMLGMLQGAVHTVLTGYCVLALEKQGWRTEHVRVVRSKVKIRALSAVDIRRYVETGEPMDKAGAYAAQGVGMGMVESISGSYTNVVGLPMSQLLSDLERLFGVVPKPPRRRR